eukprot:1507324-Pyramimonas_sp.AAC.1
MFIIGLLPVVVCILVLILLVILIIVLILLVILTIIAPGRVARAWTRCSSTTWSEDSKLGRPTVPGGDAGGRPLGGALRQGAGPSPSGASCA